MGARRRRLCDGVDWTDTVPLPTPRPLCADTVVLPDPADSVTVMLLDIWLVAVGTECWAVIVALCERDEAFLEKEEDAVPLLADNALEVVWATVSVDEALREPV